MRIAWFSPLPPVRSGIAAYSAEVLPHLTAHFDIEVAFLYPWAMALRDLGWNGFVQVLLFMALLLAGYIYVWRKGVLEWGNEIADRRSTIGD